MAMAAAQHPFDQLLELAGRSGQGGAAQAASPTSSGALGLRVGAHALLFALAETGEIVPVPRLTRVPGVQPWLLGIVSLRGRIVPVIDLGDFLEGRHTSIGPRTRIVIASGGDWSYGLVVDEIIGMRPIGPANRLPELPAGTAPTLKPYARAAYAIDNQVWSEFDIGRLLADPRFMAAAL
ncbi:MAG TPA: chemotaxis protein CheW [Plasticicumulans sp.]|uniref:chemotaxis protein CheW n=2 Tax=Plasticicumulans sp. TaxID=2307179 RepID=UPI002C896D12|nr:chemotaxis protein CheW [Plasticicumulans sp.]HMV39874.1 chemotaxis protein CheW [Plasticicumulans sp.]HMX54173.1 chemotaxis protein CheW [Plasticicumulans sp.]HMZ10526.1 chemotaxis protein CheW [Plasticicumulans sp.]